MAINNTKKWYPSLNSVVIGPGLGRDDILTNYFSDLIREI